MAKKLFPTTLVGSMPRPQHIKDLVQERLSKGLVDEQFQRLMDEAVPFIIQMQELAGLDIVSDGEWRRTSYSDVIADICQGFKFVMKEEFGRQEPWLVVTDELYPRNPGLLAREAKFLKSHTQREIKVALPSPYLLGQRMWDPEVSKKAYPTRKAFTEALVPVLRQELIALRDEGVAIAQFDDPHLCLFVDSNIRSTYENPDEEMDYCIDMLNGIVDGVEGIKLALHLCRRYKGRSGWVGEGGYEPILPALRKLKFNIIMMEFAMPKAGDKRILKELPENLHIGLGCVDCRNPRIDTPEEIVSRVKQALEFVAPERLILHPDCGFAPGSASDIPIDEAYRKLRSQAIAAERLRNEYA